MTQKVMNPLPLAGGVEITIAKMAKAMMAEPENGGWGLVTAGENKFLELVTGTLDPDRQFSNTVVAIQGVIHVDRQVTGGNPQLVGDPITVELYFPRDIAAASVSAGDWEIDSGDPRLGYLTVGKSGDYSIGVRLDTSPYEDEADLVVMQDTTPFDEYRLRPGLRKFSAVAQYVEPAVTDQLRTKIVNRRSYFFTTTV